MILLMERKASEEAKKLRERILEKGLPCAASFSPFDTSLLPYTQCVLTTRESYSTVRAYLASDRFADLPIFFLSEDDPEKVFRTDGSPSGNPVGKTLPMVDAFLPYIGPQVRRQRGIKALFFPNGFIISPLQLYYRITSLNLTVRERRILQFLLYHPGEHPCHRIALCAYPKPAPDYDPKEERSVVTAISCINRKTDKAVCMRFLKRAKKAEVRSYYFQMP